MAIFYRFRDLGIDAATHGITCIVDYWQSKADHDAGEPPWKSNTHTFVLNGGRTERRIIRNAQGHWRTRAGIFIDPERLVGNGELDPEWAYETVDRDIGNVIRQGIERYADKLAAGPDHPCSIDKRARARDDPRDFRPGELGLDDQGFEVRERSQR